MTRGIPQPHCRARRCLRVTVLLLTLLLLGSCSSVQFAYGQLDRWMRWQLDDYVDFTRSQKHQLKASLDIFHSWHRRTQLPRYAELLQQLANGVEEGQLENVQLEPVEEQMHQFWETSSRQLYDSLLPLAAELEPAQIDELEQNLWEKRRESLEKWQKSPEKIERRRRKQIRKQSERWLGSLSNSQEALIADWVHQVAYNPLLRDEQRQLWQARFLELLRRKPDGYLDKLRDLMLNPEQLWSPEYRQMQEQRYQQARALGEQILTSTTPAQRQHLIETLRDFAADFNELANR